MYPLFITVPIYNAEKYLPNFLLSLKKQTFYEYELVIFDDGSRDNSLELIKNIFPNAHMLYGDGNCWWSRSVNSCIRYALSHNCDYVLTLNVDLVLDKKYLEMMIKYANNKDDIILGSAIYDIETKKIYDTGININWLTAKNIKNIHVVKDKSIHLFDVSYLSGRGLLVPRKAFEEIGLFDSFRFPQYAADIVFTSLAKEKGFNLYCNTKAIIFSYTKQTGSTLFTGKFSLKNLIQFLTHIKSPGNLRIRWKTAIQIAPQKNLIQFIILDSIRNIAGYIKVMLLTIRTNKS